MNNAINGHSTRRTTPSEESYGILRESNGSRYLGNDDTTFFQQPRRNTNPSSSNRINRAANFEDQNIFATDRDSSSCIVNKHSTRTHPSSPLKVVGQLNSAAAAGKRISPTALNSPIRVIPKMRTSPIQGMGGGPHDIGTIQDRSSRLSSFKKSGSGRIIPIQLDRSSPGDRTSITSSSTTSKLKKDATYHKLPVKSHISSPPSEYRIPIMTEDEYVRSNRTNATAITLNSTNDINYNTHNHQNFSNAPPIVAAATKIQAWWRGMLTRQNPVVLQKLHLLRMKRIEDHVCNIYQQIKIHNEERKIEKEMRQTELQMLKLMWAEIKELKNSVETILSNTNTLPMLPKTQIAATALDTNHQLTTNSSNISSSSVSDKKNNPLDITTITSRHNSPNKFYAGTSGIGDKNPINEKFDENEHITVSRASPEVLKCTISEADKWITTSQPCKVNAIAAPPNPPDRLTTKTNPPNPTTHIKTATAAATTPTSDQFLADLDALENKVMGYEKLHPDERNFLLTNVSSTIMALQENLAKCLLGEAENTSKELRKNNDFIAQTATVGTINHDGKALSPTNTNVDSSDITLLAADSDNHDHEERTPFDDRATRLRDVMAQNRGRGKTHSLDNANIIEKALNEVPNGDEYPIKYPQIFEYLTKRTSQSNDGGGDVGGIKKSSASIKNADDSVIMVANNNNNNTDVNGGPLDETKVVDEITEDIVNSILLKAVKKYNDTKSHRSLSARANRFFDIDLTKL